MPLVVWMLGLAIMVQGTSELMVAGLLPAIATDAAVSLPTASLTISAFAVGMVLGAPVLAVATRRLTRRWSLVVLLALFVAAHVVGATAVNFEILLLSRAAAAFVYAGFWAVAASTAVDAVPAHAQGRAMSIVVGGLTLSVLLGLPLGTWVGQIGGWRSAFWMVAVAATVIMVVLARFVPAGSSEEPGDPEGDDARSVRAILAGLATRPLLIGWSTISLATAALLATFAFLAPIATDDLGLPARWIPGVMLLYGGGALAGVVLGGRVADRAPLRTSQTGLGGLVCVSMALALLAPVTVVGLVLIGLLGFTGFVTNPALQIRIFAHAGRARTLAAALSVSAFNVGIAAGPWLSGLVLDGGAHPRDAAWVGTCLAVVALLVVGSAGRRVHAPSRPQHIGNGGRQ